MEFETWSRCSRLVFWFSGQEKLLLSRTRHAWVLRVRYNPVLWFPTAVISANYKGML